VGGYKTVLSNGRRNLERPRYKWPELITRAESEETEEKAKKRGECECGKGG
jgi:hypothetical protein